MGQYFYLIDKGNKTFYRLGGGGWYALNEDLEAIMDLEYLTNYIINNCFHIDGCSEAKKQEIIEHVKNRAAPDLFAAFGQSKTEDLVITDDGGDDITICKVKKYKCVGSRYHEKDSKEYKEDMEYLNKHLEDTDLNKRWYNPNNYTRYPEWQKY